MTASLRVGVAGLGAIGMTVARALDGSSPGLELSAVSARDRARAETRLAEFADAPPVLPLDELADLCDVVVEALPPAAFREVAAPAVEAGRHLIVLSVTQLVDNWDLVERAADTGAVVQVASGALLGFDGVRAAARSPGFAMTLSTAKPPASLAKSPYVVDNAMALPDEGEAPLRLFAGTVREAARHFPANVNVAVAAALAGKGVDETRYELWADPGVARNIHRIAVTSEATAFTVRAENLPDPENPATSMMTPLSVVAALEALTARFRVGS